MHRSPTLHRQPRHLLFRPILPHVLRAQFLDLVVQMLPQHLSKTVHDVLQFGQPELALAGTALFQILCQLVQPLVNLLVLCKEFQLFLERGLLLR